MGLFKRIHRITVGRIETFLDRAEDPEVIFPVLIQEMEKQLKAATEAEAKASAAVKAAQRDLKRQQEKVDRFGKGAAQSLKKGDEETARMSIEAQIEAEKNLAVAQQNVDSATDSLDHANAARRRIQQQLDELRTRKEDILTRARVAKAQKKIQRTVSGSAGSTDSILDAVARLEAGVEQAEAELEIQASLTGTSNGSPSLEKCLRDLDHDSEVEARLSQIRLSIAESA
ncbi:MAG TPA: PspA/IM30 family protein [Anaerohalosphaeraceae bacterium]|jgi:phage shock protein A|nr:PspA/IM30 family protein [Anaerohalosphaeraceae bacterium]HRT50145.1 PspA/IM30 family protein [Anaerohalosphaeraceae bacterium]HRT86079.1 PspA/IM30 family protein [Anaerohalosphaeraceae bacterium]